MTYAGFLLLFVVPPLVLAALCCRGALRRGGWRAPHVHLGPPPPRDRGMSERLSYLWHLGVWAVPVLALQLAVLAWTTERPAGALLRAAAVPVVVVTGWLVAADHVAIAAGIWHFDEGESLGLRIGAVPVEEVLFFLTTNTLVAGGTILLDGLAGRGPAR